MIRSRLAYRFIRLQFLIFFFVGSTIVLPGAGNVVRLKFTLSLLLTVVFLPFLIAAFNRCMITKSSILAAALLILYFYPALIMALIVAGLRPLPEGLNLWNVFMSGIPWILNGILFLVTFTYWNEEEHLKFQQLLWKASLLLSIEAAVFFYLLGNTSIASWSVNDVGRFSSFFHLGAEVIGVYGLILIGLSLLNLIQGKNKRKYKIGIVLGLLLAFSSLQRSVLVAVIIFFSIVGLLYLMRGIRRMRPESKVMQASVVSLLFFIFLALSGTGFALYRIFTAIMN